MAIDAALIKIHNDSLAAGATHETATCVICTPSLLKEGITVDAEEFASQLKERDEEVARLTARVESLSDLATQADIDTKVEAAKAEAQVQIDDLQAKLDASVVEAGANKKQFDDLVDMINTEAAKQTADTEREALKATRMEMVAPYAALLPENYADENADRWTSMSEEAFLTLVDGWKNIAGDRVSESASKVPSKTALNASSDEWHKPVGGKARIRDDIHAINAARYERGVKTDRI